MDNKSRLAESREAGIRRISSQLHSKSPRAVAVIPAAGHGSRSGLALPKQYYRLAGETVLGRSIRALAALEALALIVVVVRPDDSGWMDHGLDAELRGLDHVIAVPVGGASRRDSVMAGCTVLQEALKTLGKNSREADPWVLVHDAARPGLDAESLSRLWRVLTELSCEGASTALRPSGISGAILAAPVADTLKHAVVQTELPYVGRTVDRSTLWAAQTPQAFQLDELLLAYAQHTDATDEASAIEAIGGRVRLVQGDGFNLKLTQPNDFQLMEAVIHSEPNRRESNQSVFTKGRAMEHETTPMNPPFAIGQGFDVHALVEGRPLVIGGVTIPYHLGLDGHSDADVLLHAITDAILGAAGMGDIGRHFPDTDARFRGADSRLLLEEAVRRVAESGWAVAQVDATVIAQAPKISPFADAMVSVIAGSCGLNKAQVNIKGKTTEKLGFTGRGEGIAAQAIAMLVRRG
jgi:2-C-methyl-D-erythritol 4-phosphate cytidylyltransferase/2-C-methyl-D-erythritol 2,4-cyclodiphosphate synthase